VGFLRKLLDRVLHRDEIEVHEGGAGGTFALGNPAQMLEVMEDNAASWRQRGEMEALGDLLGHIAQLKLDLLGDEAGAIADLEERRAAYVSIGEITGECDCLYALCSIRAAQGDQDEAQNLWDALRERAVASGDDELIVAANELGDETGCAPSSR
jgi:hypothetical protein